MNRPRVSLSKEQKNRDWECCFFFFLSFTAAVATVSDIADQANDNLKDGVSTGLSARLRPPGVLN